MTDEEFQSALRMLEKGNKEGLRQIYEKYIKLIYAVCYDVVKNKEDAEDVTSEFFIKLIRVAGTFKKGSPHKTWLVTIARNMAIDFLRKNKKEVLAFENPDNSEENVFDKTSDETEKNTEYSAVDNKAILTVDMKRAMSTLQTDEKEVVDLKLIGQFKLKEIADITGKPIGTVSWLYNKGVSKLRRCLKDYERE